MSKSPVTSQSSPKYFFAEYKIHNLVHVLMLLREMLERDCLCYKLIQSFAGDDFWVFLELFLFENSSHIVFKYSSVSWVQISQEISEKVWMNIFRNGESDYMSTNGCLQAYSPDWLQILLLYDFLKFLLEKTIVCLFLIFWLLAFLVPKAFSSNIRFTNYKVSNSSGVLQYCRKRVIEFLFYWNFFKVLKLPIFNLK